MVGSSRLDPQTELATRIDVTPGLVALCRQLDAGAASARMRVLGAMADRYEAESASRRLATPPERAPRRRVSRSASTAGSRRTRSLRAAPRALVEHDVLRALEHEQAALGDEPLVDRAEAALERRPDRACRARRPRGSSCRPRTRRGRRRR